MHWRGFRRVAIGRAARSICLTGVRTQHAGVHISDRSLHRSSLRAGPRSTSRSCTGPSSAHCTRNETTKSQTTRAFTLRPFASLQAERDARRSATGRSSTSTGTPLSVASCGATGFLLAVAEQSDSHVQVTRALPLCLSSWFLPAGHLPVIRGAPRAEVM